MKSKTSTLVLIVILVLGVFSGCDEFEKIELPKNISDKDFYEEGYNFSKECMNNIEIREYKINTNQGFLGKYGKYELDDKKQTYYNLLNQFAINYNKFKETNDEEYLDNMLKIAKEITFFLEMNTK